MARILSIGTAVPPYTYNQAEIRDFSKQLFQDTFPHIDRLLSIFENTAIEQRYFSRPREWYEEDRSFKERNQIYIEMACQLGEQAIQRCLESTGIQPHEIDHFLFVSTTGLATPSIDAHLINRLKMKPHVKRTPIWGLGCAGGVAGLARAYEYVQAFPTQRVLLLTLELCGLTFRRDDRSKSNLVATSLFADGAAAVLVTGSKSNPYFGPRIVTTKSIIWPESMDVMGWELEDDGLKVIFSRDIPTLVRKQMRPIVDEFLEEINLQLGDIQYVISHPGGRKVLEAYQEALGISRDPLTHAYSVLRDYGNMSSATVFFVLERELQESHPYGSYGLVTALGPGFSSELALLCWDEEVACHV
ncbi:type III polyketide synthase [Thermoflavimicrobium dichotomicum]|uniref:Alkylresorcinol/alkylpyrone synthase n=1 Tax=Thermoflavimicrobium dichotomicum TaxID=46223 RepID=A0A1I3LUP5_9BACL|nr:3-oxoacyl-[acyl-carrier-protein] synthase III C-terminal domain-containing protein [Thermoflavimicrobium dichotomicum]SFI88427.1 alkylresorcinol/alkylpyrone synthase [Thermoflavimicrobium dichotomicum]